MKNDNITSRELVKSTLELKNTGRAPRHMWTLPWSETNYPDELKRIRSTFPDDIVTMLSPLTAEGFTTRPGDPEGNGYEIGTYLDVWGCRFTNMHRGVIGEETDCDQGTVPSGVYPSSADGCRIPDENASGRSGYAVSAYSSAGACRCFVTDDHTVGRRCVAGRI